MLLERSLLPSATELREKRQAKVPCRHTYGILGCSRALVGVTDKAGNSIFKGKKFTGFSNAEEEIVGKVKVFSPRFLIGL